MSNVKRAAYSPSIHQIQDVCVGLVDTEGNILACAPGLPMFLADMGDVVRDGIELLGIETFEPGDVYISNDPLTIGTHINNVATYSPIFSDGLVGFAVARGHMVDMGGAYRDLKSTRLTEIYQEGLRIRQLRFYARGEPEEAIHRLIADNTRMPEELSLSDIPRPGGGVPHRRAAARRGGEAVRACAVRAGGGGDLRPR